MIDKESFQHMIPFDDGQGIISTYAVQYFNTNDADYQITKK